MKLLAAMVLLALPVIGAVDGVVVNQTTGKPQPDVTVTLIRLGQGMETAGSAKTDGQGHFAIAQDVPQGSPALIQALYSGVTYNKMLPPGMPASGVNVEVFESSTKASTAKVAQHMMLLEPSGTELAVSESIVFVNDGKLTFNDPEGGTLQFYLPPAAAGKVRVTVNGPQGMPLQKPAEKAPGANTYKVKYPVKPGETRFDLSYSLPMPNPPVFESKVLHGDSPLRIVAPKGVQLSGEGVTSLGPEPRTQATIYDVKGAAYKVEIAGTGSLRASAEAAPQEDQGPPIEESKPRVYDRIYMLLALSLSILLIGFILLYRAEAPATKSHS
ncbi:MAG TPA: hypothetical protein VMZ52_15035 [Bryobacteraceae bacterium]|nr:hypothetical protein [Bryobacteraceae bacterium]